MSDNTYTPPICYWVQIENIRFSNNIWKMYIFHVAYYFYFSSNAFLKGIPLLSALPVLHWQFKAGTEEQQEFLWTTLVLSEEKTLIARPRTLTSGPGKCFSFQQESGITCNCPVLQWKEPGPEDQIHLSFFLYLSSMWGRKKERSDTHFLA